MRMCMYVCICIYTAISNKVVIVNSWYWNRKELWVSSNTNNLFLFASTLQNIECRFIIMPQPCSNNIRWRVITHYDCMSVCMCVYVCVCAQFGCRFIVSMSRCFFICTRAAVFASFRV